MTMLRVVYVVYKEQTTTLLYVKSTHNSSSRTCLSSTIGSRESSLFLLHSALLYNNTGVSQSAAAESNTLNIYK